MATSIAASTAVLIISAISTNAIESSSAISSNRWTPTRERGDQHGDGDREVDAHVPLRAEHVDDALEGEVEAVAAARARGGAAHARRAPLARLHLVAVVVAEQVQQRRARAARATPRRRPAGQSDDVAELRAAALRHGSRPSSGNESTSVASSMPRCSRLRARISSGPTNASPSSPSSTPSAASTRAREHGRGLARRPPRRCGSRPRRRPRLTCAAPVPVSSACCLYASTMRCTSLCRTTSWCVKRTKRDPVDGAEDVLHLDQPGRLLARQVDLRHVAGDDDLRAEAEPRQEHLHLLGARVLRLVEDDEGVVERAAAHEGERRDLDRRRAPCRRAAARRRACRRARRRAGAGTGRPWRACRPGGSRAARRPRPRGA